MYFSIDYKFVFVYEASPLSREVGGSSNRPRGTSMSGSRLCEGGDIYSPKGQSTAAGSQQGHFGSGSQQGRSGSGSQHGHVGEDANQQCQGCHQFQYLFH